MACLGTETNSFSPIPTGMQEFADTMLCHGNGAANGRHPIAEPLRVWRRLAEERQMRVSESLSAFAEPGGMTAGATYEALRDEILADLRSALPVEIVLLSLHGAMIAEGYPDAEGDLLARVRELAGPKATIGVEYDLHVHLTEAKTRPANVVVTYKEYPHTDIGERAHEVFALAERAASATIVPTTAVRRCGINAYLPTTAGAMRDFVTEMRRAERTEGVLSVSLAHGFPHGDVADLAARLVVITDNDPAKAQTLANSLAAKLWETREALRPNYLSIDAALDEAIRSEGPVVLADTSDNAGCGAANDSTFILRRMLERGLTSVVSANYWDPVAVRFCFAAGVGGTLRLRLGGKAGPDSGEPVDLSVRVMAVQRDATQTFNGFQVPIGDTVWVQGEGIDLILNTHRFQTGHPDMMTQLGLDPATRHIIVVKSTQHFYAGFAPIARKVLYVAGPGTSNPDTRALSYQHVEMPFWPRDQDAFATI
ncbi:M81 family metallopeptidase [Acidisphaera sp. S103]|uniref:M81 family metallopeptidase n=1 Tax=Acidisphaera sp. S103 TaxID=1747223 RepID=UPI0021103529|nr:M81 family metallopeptidase [Acidisphaera sp. S103]